MKADRTQNAIASEFRYEHSPSRTSSELFRLIESTKQDSWDPQFAVIRSVTLLERTARSWVHKLVDHGTPYIARGLMVCEERLKLDAAAIPLIGFKGLSFGEFVGYSLRTDTFGTMLDGLDGMADDSFLRLLALEQDEDGQQLIEDPTKLKANIAKLVDTRNTIVHELPSTPPFLNADLNEWLHSLQRFAQAGDALIWKLTHRGRTPPRSGLEQLEQAVEAAEEASLAMKEAYREAMASCYDEENRRLLQLAQTEWERFRSATLEFASDNARGGTLAHLIRAGESEFLDKERTAWLKGYILVR